MFQPVASSPFASRYTSFETWTSSCHLRMDLNHVDFVKNIYPWTALALLLWYNVHWKYISSILHRCCWLILKRDMGLPKGAAFKCNILQSLHLPSFSSSPLLHSPKKKLMHTTNADNAVNVHNNSHLPVLDYRYLHTQPVLFEKCELIERFSEGIWSWFIASRFTADICSSALWFFSAMNILNTTGLNGKLEKCKINAKSATHSHQLPPCVSTQYHCSALGGRDANELVVTLLFSSV